MFNNTMPKAKKMCKAFLGYCMKSKQPQSCVYSHLSTYFFTCLYLMFVFSFELFLSQTEHNKIMKAS